MTSVCASSCQPPGTALLQNHAAAQIVDRIKSKIERLSSFAGHGRRPVARA